MDTTDCDIQFDENGICNHCRYYDKVASKGLFSGQEGETKLQQIADEIKENGKDKDYDCILGLSGGVDSSLVAYHANRLGLRPLAVHFDNGWNSEISVRNVEKIVQKLNLDLHTYVMDWEEFRDLQLSFLKASVLDIEMLTDHAIIATMFDLARKNGIKYMLIGTNVVTESILPKSWSYAKWDIRNIKAIQKRFGQKRIDKFPTCGLLKTMVTKRIGKIHFVEILNYVDYNKQKAIEILEDRFGWQYYGGKHYESIFTKFYQAYILPTKFNIDKRKAHLSNLICSGQITRNQAIEEMKKALYDPEELREDKEYILKKLCLTDEEFNAIMKLPVRSHLDYPNGQRVFNQLERIRRLLRRSK